MLRSLGDARGRRGRGIGKSGALRSVESRDDRTRRVRRFEYARRRRRIETAYAHRQATRVEADFEVRRINENGAELRSETKNGC
jgi:hypothetical protein